MQTRHVSLTAGLVVAAALLFAYRDALAAMVGMWNNSPMYSYGFTVPLVSGYLVWSRREGLRGLTPRPSWLAGGVVLALALAMTIAARAGGIQILEQLAFLVALTAAVLLLFGAPYVRAAWAAIAYLLLMIPLWDGFTEPLHEPFQQRSAAIGVWLLHLIDVPAYREGTFITLPNLQIEVARVCSGVNYLVAVVALGLPLAYVFLRDNWRRALLVVMAVVVAALSNGLRVALICALAYYEVGSPLHGPFHVLHGLFVAGIGYVVLLVGLGFLTPRGSSAGAARPAAHRAAETSPVVMPGTGWTRLAAGAVMSGLLLATGVNAFAPAQRRVPLAGDLVVFPWQLGAWVSDITRAEQAGPARAWAGADVEIKRRYVRADGVSADVYIGYFSSQTQGKEVVSYRATELHSDATQMRLASGPRGRGFDANYVPAGRDGVATLFWYEVAGRPEVHRFLVKGWTLWGAMAKGESSAAVVVLTAGGGGGERMVAALQELAPLVQAAVAARLSVPGAKDSELEE